jgi:uncharacterized protein (DUF433 family)
MISRKKTIQGGVPVIAGTRVPVSVLIGYSFEIDGLKRAKSEYPQLTTHQILAAWTYAQQKLLSSVHGSLTEV